jgi:16S rRNA (uracil1498-N3)-methyltransferase
MRKCSGDSIELINGKGLFAHAEIDSKNEHKKGVYCTVTKVLEEKSPKLRSTLIQAIIRPQKLELVVEKACELGVTSLIFVRCERSDKSSPKSGRLEHIAISALKQSGRLHLPIFQEATSLEKALTLAQEKNLFYGAIDGAPFVELQKSITSRSVTFCIGPEGGFTQKEFDLLSVHSAKGVSLGPHVLRSETASILACGLMATC